jgi:hypothetical protein
MESKDEETLSFALGCIVRICCVDTDGRFVRECLTHEKLIGSIVRILTYTTNPKIVSDCCQLLWELTIWTPFDPALFDGMPPVMRWLSSTTKTEEISCAAHTAAGFIRNIVCKHEMEKFKQVSLAKNAEYIKAGLHRTLLDLLKQPWMTADLVVHVVFAVRGLVGNEPWKMTSSKIIFDCIACDALVIFQQLLAKHMNHVSAASTIMIFLYWLSQHAAPLLAVSHTDEKTGKPVIIDLVVAAIKQHPTNDDLVTCAWRILRELADASPTKYLVKEAREQIIELPSTKGQCTEVRNAVVKIIEGRA